MKDVHTYRASDGWRWGLVAENASKLGHGGQGYANKLDMVNVLDSLFKAVVSFTEGHVPWETCTLHEASNGKCYIYKIYDARTLVRSVVESSPEPARDAQ
jgi:hypothetical protein